MTSNQIAAEANAIRREELEETKRHNVESEFIQTDKNQIEKNYNNAMTDLKNRELELTDKLKSLELAISKSQGDEKNRLQEEYNSVYAEYIGIQGQMADTESMYKTVMAGNALMATGETIRSNKANEAIRAKANTIKEHEVDIVERNEEGLTKKGRSQILVNDTKAYEQMGDPRAVTGKIYIQASELGRALAEKEINDRKTRAHITTHRNGYGHGSGHF